MSTGSVGELKEEKRGSVASRCRRAALTCLVRNSLVRFAPARSLAGDRRRPNLAVSPTIEFFHLRQTFSQAFHLPSLSCLRYFYPSVGSLSFPFLPTILHALHEIRESTFRSIHRSAGRIFSIFNEEDDSFPEDRVSRDGEVEDAPVAVVSGDGLAAAAMVMVVVVVVLVPVKKRKKKKK